MPRSAGPAAYIHVFWWIFRGLSVDNFLTHGYLTLVFGLLQPCFLWFLAIAEVEGRLHVTIRFAEVGRLFRQARLPLKRARGLGIRYRYLGVQECHGEVPLQSKDVCLKAQQCADMGHVKRVGDDSWSPDRGQMHRLGERTHAENLPISPLKERTTVRRWRPICRVLRAIISARASLMTVPPSIDPAS
jgi:hypothetical protein